ncbi:MAG: cadmium-containing carbonic anhydrase [Candidatus Saccharimonadales bacterium]
MPDETLEYDKTIEVACITEKGLGFGEGSISVNKRIESGELSADELRTGIDIIKNADGVFVSVDADADDDGCGDGRQAARVFRINKETGLTEEFNASRRRAKVFGGGLVVASSMWRAINGPAQHQETVYGDRAYIADKLEKLHISFGAHTDSHASGDNCGCGAIDKYPLITQNILTHRSSIEATLQVLYGDSYEENKEFIDKVFATYDVVVDDENYFSNAAGSKTMGLIEESGAVVKELADHHLEAYVVLNDIDGTTLDQRALDIKFSQAGIRSELQVFVVDIWRGRMYSDAMAQLAAEVIPETNFEEARATAYADFLIRTLAVSSTLTAGDQPVLARMQPTKSDFSLAA